MKKFLILCSLIASLTEVNAQTTYSVTKNINYTDAKIPAQCSNCTINISNGVTLTIDEDIYLQNTTFNGGTISTDSKDITFWSNGAFNNVTVEFNKTANLVNSGTLTINNSEFDFYKTSGATVYTSINMISSSWKFFANSNMNATGGTFTLKGSSLTAGDGTASSKAYIKFNGANLSILDNISFVTAATSKNYYFNWSNYNGNGTSIKTTDNNLNCGTHGNSACSSPSLYGPSSLSAGGVSSSAILPVKLSAFDVKLSGHTVALSWTTDEEMNSNYFSIERSIDGINWTPIGKVAAQGNTSLVTKYTYADASPLSGTSYYRLNMIDLDGSSEYSPIKDIKNAAAASADTHEMRIYPNPATNYVVISSKDGSSSNVSIQLISMNGQVLKQVNGSSANVNIPVSEFRSGTYIVRVADSVTGAAQSFKLLIAK